MTNHRILSLPVTALALGLAATPASAATQDVAIRFKAVSGSTPIQCDSTIPGLGTTKAAAQLKDLRFYVSGVKLIRKDGTAVSVKVRANKQFRVAGTSQAASLIDLENGKGQCSEEGTPEMNGLVAGTVKQGDYVGATFSVGLPFTLNHSDTVGAPAPLASAAMAWNWQFGRKLMKIEVADPAGPVGGTWASPVWYLHVGSTGCEGDPATGATVKCRATNASKIKLAKFNPATQAVAIDVAPLFKASDLTKSPDEMPGCMSGPVDAECGPLFSALGIGWSANGLSSGQPTATQTVFRAVKR